MKKLLLLGLSWFGKTYGQSCTQCSFATVADDTVTLPGNTNRLSSVTFAQVSENAVVAFTAYDTKSQVGLYYRDTTKALDYYVDQKNSRTPDSNVAYTGLIRGDNSGTTARETMSYIGRYSGGVSVYIATVQNGTRTYITIANRNTTVPGGTNKFTDFTDSSTDIATGNVVFLAESSIGTGLYLSTVSGSTRTLSRITDFTANLPGTTLKYTYLTGPKICGSKVLFMGSNYNASAPPAKPAIVLYDIPSGNFTTVVDYRNTIPGYPSQTYRAFSTPGIDTKAGYIGFVAQGTGGYWGILKYTVSSRVVQNIADESTPIPGFSGRYFTGFQGPPSPNTDGRIAFRIVHEPDAITGVWLATPSGNSHTIIRICGVTSNLSGIGVIERIGYGGEAFLDRTIAFTATVRISGVARAGVYRVTLPASDMDLVNATTLDDNVSGLFYDEEQGKGEEKLEDPLRSFPKFLPHESHLREFLN